MFKRESLLRKEKNSIINKIYYYRWCYIFLLPTVIVYLMFVLWPVLGSIYYSFFQWEGFTAWPQNFIGLQNYIEIIKDKYFWNSMLNTLQFVFFQNIIKLPLSLLIAWVLNNPRLRGKNIYRALFFLPVISSTAIIGIVMTFIFSPLSGPFNELLVSLNILSRPVDWLGQSATAMWVIIGVETWHMAGQYIIYWLAGLQSIPYELYEAAEIDGANGWQSFIYITIPALKPVIVVVTLLSIVNSLRVFAIVQAMTGGGPSYSTDVVTTFIYRNAFSTAITRLGYASAAAVFFGILVMGAGSIQGLIVNKVNQ